MLKAYCDLIIRVPFWVEKEQIPEWVSALLVREMGLEPTRRNHTHLKRACRPFQHSRKCLYIITCEVPFVNNYF